jgi:exodeoxyribonuclease VII large subunit
VARAIYDSEIPVISAVGHEPDVTVADFVADVRAATPSNAAELAVPDAADVYAALSAYANRLGNAERRLLGTWRQRLDALAGRRVMQNPRNLLDDRRLALDRAGDRLSAAMKGAVSRRREAFAGISASLDALSPLKVLGRGYAIARDAENKVVKSARDVRPGDKLRLRLQKDELTCTVDEE